jgi:type VI protein secretion system component Hcp
MKKSLLFLIFVLAFVCGNAQTSVFVKLTPYPNSGITLVDENPGTAHTGQIALSTISNGEIQTLNIGSQSTGAGAGKILFDSINFTKPISINSSTLFSMMCSGTPFKFAEFSYYNSSNQIIYRQTLSLAAVKSMARTTASCSSGCPGIIENISFEYGTEVFTYYTTPGNLNSGISKGWDRVHNVAFNDPTQSVQ